MGLVVPWSNTWLGSCWLQLLNELKSQLWADGPTSSWLKRARAQYLPGGHIRWGTNLGKSIYSHTASSSNRSGVGSLYIDDVTSQCPVLDLHTITRHSSSWGTVRKGVC